MKSKGIPPNIDSFNRVVAVGLLKLYASFPVRIDLNAEDVAWRAASEAGLEDGALWSFPEQVHGALEFLAREGFIQYRPDLRTMEEHHLFHDAQLTMKGLAILGAVPITVDEGRDRRPLVERLQEGLKEGTVDVLAKAVGAIFGAAIGMS